MNTYNTIHNIGENTDYVYEENGEEKKIETPTGTYEISAIENLLKNKLIHSPSPEAMKSGKKIFFLSHLSYRRILKSTSRGTNASITKDNLIKMTELVDIQGRF